MKLSRRKKVVFSLIAFGLVWGTAECALRLFGFERNTTVETMKFTFRFDELNASTPVPLLEHDDRLFWKPRPFVLGHNSRGLVGPEFSLQKPAGTFRIVCLGDSCTHFGDPASYPQIMQSLLDERMPGRFEVINAGTMGYSSLQGLRRLTDDVAQWAPDLVTVYFGWNDHWRARFLPDRQQQPTLPQMVTLHNTLDHSRVFQLLSFAATRFTAASETKFRVDRREYADNLNEMSRICRQIDSEIWYITAPHALEFGIPNFLFTSGEVAAGENLIELHQSYNDVVRSVAASQTATLIDLDREFESMDKPTLFLADHIHLTELGRRLLAQRLMKELQTYGVLGNTPRKRGG